MSFNWKQDLNRIYESNQDFGEIANLLNLSESSIKGWVFGYWKPSQENQEKLHAIALEYPPLMVGYNGRIMFRQKKNKSNNFKKLASKISQDKVDESSVPEPQVKREIPTADEIVRVIQYLKSTGIKL